jgi:hypothetical protein
LACELPTDVRDGCLNSREEVADREKWQVERQLEELATAKKRLEELEVAWETRRRKSGTFWARLRPL